MMEKFVHTEFYRWIMLGLVGALVIIVTGLANRNVYDKDEVDRQVQTVVELHDKDVGNQQRQLNRMELKIDKLVDRLIEEE